MKKRALSSIVILLATGLAVASTLLYKGVFDVFIALIGVVAACEVCNMLKLRGIRHNRFMACMFIAIIYIPVVFCGNTSVGIGELLLFMLASLIVWAIVTFIYEIFANLKVKEKDISNVDNKNTNIFKTSFETSAGTLIVGVYPSLLLSMFYVLNHLDNYLPISNKYFILWIIILIFAIQMMSDTLAYMVGTKLKGPKVCKRISPNKSWSGCVGGLFGGVIGALIVYAFLQIGALNSILSIMHCNIWGFVALGLFGSFICQVGDFFESYLKRKAGLRDSGNLLPGHGGMLDRIDALMFNVVFITIFVILVI